MAPTIKELERQVRALSHKCRDLEISECRQPNGDLVYGASFRDKKSGVVKELTVILNNSGLNRKAVGAEAVKRHLLCSVLRELERL